MPFRYGVYEIEYDHDTLDNPSTVDGIVRPLLARAIEAMPNPTRLVAEPKRMVLEAVSPTGEVTLLYGIPPHVSERVLDLLRRLALYSGAPFNASKQGKICVIHNQCRPFDIFVEYETRFFGRDEILNFSIVENQTDMVAG